MKDQSGQLFVISAPSGAGKTSLVNALVNRLDQLRLSISHTTRPKRPDEKDQLDYYFVGEAAFKEMIAADQFLEHAVVFDNYYGTSREAVETILRDGHDVILEIDWQGARKITKSVTKAVTIFILPPSYQELRSRLESRGGDSAQTIEHRMREAVNEISHYDEYQYLVINDDFDQALSQLCTIATATRLQTLQQSTKYADIIEHLVAQ